MAANSSSGTRAAPYFTWEGSPQQSYPLTLDIAVVVDDGNSIGLSAGTPTVKNVNTIVDDGNSISLAAGTPTVTTHAFVVDDGNSISLAAGTPTVTNLNKIVDDGNAISLAAGTPTVTTHAFIVDDGNAISLAFGTPAVVEPIVALSAAISLAAGTPTVTTHAFVVDDGNAISLAFGTPKVLEVIFDDGNAISLAAGTPTVTNLNKIVDDGNSISLTAGTPTVTTSNKIVDDGNAISLAAGTPHVTTLIVDDGNSISLAAGTPTVTQSAAIINALSGAISLAFGTPTIGVLQDVVALSGSISLAFGLPTVIEGSVVQANSAPIDLSAGTPTVYSLNKIIDDGNTISLAAGTPSVTARAKIQANSGAISLIAGMPYVPAPLVVQPMSALIGLVAGTPTIPAPNIIKWQSASISLEAGAPAVIYPQSIVLLGPIEANIGDSVLIASAKLTDTSRDDNFSSIISPFKWGVTSTGAATVSVNNGVSVELNKTGGGSSYQLLSAAQYASGDISVNYDILSDFLADISVNEIVYVGLSMQFVTGELLTIKRKVHSGFNGQQIQVEYFANGVFNGGATRQTMASSGKLRLIKHTNIIAAVIDDDVEPIFVARVNPTADFYVKIYSTTSGQNTYLKAKYKTYTSSVGALFGTAPLVVKNRITDSRIIGEVPTNKIVGPVDVIVFNHFGQIGHSVNGFKYPLVLGQSLSSNGGFKANVQGDAVIRN